MEWTSRNVWTLMFDLLEDDFRVGRRSYGSGLEGCKIYGIRLENNNRSLPT